MSAKENRRELRTNPEDERIITRLEKKLGLGFSALVKLALRKLAQSEKA